jgi:putative endonuclease
VLDRNWRCSLGEIDLVLGAPGMVVVCEVKARAGTGFGGPQAAVDWHKQRRLRRLAAAWLSEHPQADAAEVRFDVAVVIGAKIDVIIAAF